MVVTYSQSFLIIYMIPIVLIAIALGLRRVWQLERYYDVVVILLAIGLGAWTGFLGTGTYSVLWVGGFLFNPLIVGLVCTRRPIAFGLLANLAVSIGGACFLFWVLARSGGALYQAKQIKFFGGATYLLCLPFVGMALSLIPTVPIALYRRYVSAPQQS